MVFFTIHPYACMLSHSFMSNSLPPHELQHTGFPSPSLSPQTHVHWVSDAIQPSHDAILYCLLLLLPSIFPRNSVFSNKSALRIRWSKYWSLSFSISTSSAYSVFIFFGIHWFDLLVVQGALKNLLQHHNSKASILPCSASFIVQLSHPYMTTGKTTALTVWTFVGKVMFLLFNMLSMFIIAFHPRSKCL